MTLCWLLPTMALAAGVGFVAARDYFAPKFLKPEDSAVQGSRPRPTRIIPPEEAAELMRSEPSDIWRGAAPTPPRQREVRRTPPPEERPAPPEDTTETSPPDSALRETSPSPPAGHSAAPGEPAPAPEAPRGD